MNYSKVNTKDMVKGMHKTKHSVKILSGPSAGTVALFDSEEDAIVESFFMDFIGVCVVRRGPLHTTRVNHYQY